MANQEQSPDGIPRKDKDRPSPDVERPASDVPASSRAATSGQASARGTGIAGDASEPKELPRAGDEKGHAMSTDSPERRDYRGDGPAKVGVTSDNQPDLVAPSGVNERDHGAADDRPAAGGELQFDDGTDEIHPRGKVTGAGRTWDEKNPSDAGKLGGTPGAGLSDRNGPSDHHGNRNR